MADKVRESSEYTQLKARYLGLGTGDTSRDDFVATVKRDTYSSLSQHHGALLYNSVAVNEPTEIVRQRMIKNMVQPIQKPS